MVTTMSNPKKPRKTETSRGGSHYIRATGKKQLTVIYEEADLQTMRIAAATAGFSSLAEWVRHVTLTAAGVTKN